MEKISTHHSFDIELAMKYGVNEAILIHHFQHWINYNKRLNRNFRDGKTWTYQTVDEIVAHFPYMTRSQVVDAIDKLCKGRSRYRKDDIPFEPVLIKGNYNKKRNDNTVWYALNDNVEALGNHKVGFVKSQSGVCENPAPIPHTIQDTKTNLLVASAPPSANADEESSFSKADNKFSKLLTQKKPMQHNVQYQQNTLIITRYFIDELKKVHKDFLEPNFNKWCSEIDKMFNIDNRDPVEIKDAIKWALSDVDFWQDILLSPKKLRKHFVMLKSRCKKTNTKQSQETYKDKVLLHFKNGKIYNGAECFISEDSIAFQRGMNHKQVKFNEKGFKDQFEGMLKKLDIKF